jgi:hypothetical protein
MSAQNIVNANNVNMSMINRLPDDVLRHIYEEYIVGVETCNRYLEMYKSEESIRLDYTPLMEPTRRLLEHPCAIEYLCKKHKIFKKMYIEHYVEGNKWFVLMDRLESFILSILMWLYH